jgi:hypothetical protein
MEVAFRGASTLSERVLDMTALMAGYAVAFVAFLIAASAAFTIVRSFREESTGKEPVREERPTRAAA